MRYVWFYETEMGMMGIVEQEGFITDVFFGAVPPEGEYLQVETALIADAGTQLREYFAGERREFDLPLKPAGTEFQQAVWQALQNIPYGQTASYGEVARAVGRPKAVRAVGGANHKNPIVVIIPCHRVIGADGSLTGYGSGLPVKQKLLRLEGIVDA